jgi:hypothetical protein
MKNIKIKNLLKSKVKRNVIILIASMILVYSLISLYFINHCFFNTVINGADVSLKAHHEVEDTIRSSIRDYKLQLVEKNGEIEEIIGQDIGMLYNEQNNISKVYQMQRSYKWINSLLKKQNYYVRNLFTFNKDLLENKINELNCLNKDIIEPQNVNFKYSNGSYEVIAEVYGNKIYKDRLDQAIEISILKGKTKLDLNENQCYANPKYTLNSYKAREAQGLLNKYVSTKITYIFGNQKEILDQNIINQWLSVDENLEVVINQKAVREYMQRLSKKYDTVGVTRRIEASNNRIVEVKGGLYGWKINRAAETIALLENIKLGSILEKEPIYIQRALSRGESDIGNTFVEINITRQYLWFYKNGKLIAQGAVVTGNPNKGNSTKVGTYMLNYKEMGTILRGPNYATQVTYWMPFYGNIGIHDASWRYSFGGDIYKTNGTHGCVNAPLYLAKKIFENIEDGTPIICYEE